MNIVIFSNSDYNFAAKLSKICDLHSYQLIFLNDFKFLKSYVDIKNILLLIDFNDYENKIQNINNLINNIGDFPCCVLLDIMSSKTHKEVTSMGFDIVMTKQSFLMNIKTIKKQITASL